MPKLKVKANNADSIVAAQESERMESTTAEIDCNTVA
ncbi:Uncharacterised protein [Vibrio cholerae]|nr:Uncharacterised protein [Vibrio cholerae]